MPPQKTVLVTEAPVFFFSELYIPENMIIETQNYAHQRG